MAKDCTTLLDQKIKRVNIVGYFIDYIGDIPIDSEAILDDTGYYIIRKANSYYCEPCNAYGDTYEPSYTFARAVTIQNSQVSSTVDFLGFPILFSGTYSYLATTINGGDVENVNAYDIIFSTDVNGSTQLNHEIESYDPCGLIYQH